MKEITKGSIWNTLTSKQVLHVDRQYFDLQNSPKNETTIGKRQNFHWIILTLSHINLFSYRLKYIKILPRDVDQRIRTYGFQIQSSPKLFLWCFQSFLRSYIWDHQKHSPRGVLRKRWNFAKFRRNWFIQNWIFHNNTSTIRNNEAATRGVL